MFICTANTCINQSSPSIIDDPRHNLPDLHSTLQHTAELHTTIRLGGVLQGLYPSPIRVNLNTT